ncbi:nucleotidyltransferase domain-containing protein [Winogradskya consettensis]|nr:nucleotidyltransferase domain-containing protein [Actinoplanes consettensis]
MPEPTRIPREGNLEGVPADFAPVVAAARTRIASTFGPERLHSAYIYGSIPRGTATPGVSDLDLMLALREEPGEKERADARTLEIDLDRYFPQIDGAGILLFSTRTLLSDLERHDLGFFTACLCTPLVGDDLAEQLPAYFPTSLLARETNGDLGLVLPEWRRRLAVNDPALSRVLARRLIRTGFTLVMPRWGSWTSDLERSTDIFAGYYPDHAGQMRDALRVARNPAGDHTTLLTLIDELGEWLAAEYTRVHGTKTPRT